MRKEMLGFVLADLNELEKLMEDPNMTANERQTAEEFIVLLKQRVVNIQNELANNTTNESE
ncbi:MAG: hypothetical protein KDD58_03495 [Bdellovibrionales bacterium]|nr:hypothetical protein [Bdellovibrionales bacterium]